MRATVMIPQERSVLFARLSSMPLFLESIFAGLTTTDASTRLGDDEFSPVEQAWHLADLEVEGYACRIRRLLEEPAPHLPDFDGLRIAAERNYRSLRLEDGLAKFRSARLANIETLRGVAEAAWSRAGTQEGVGPVSLCDLAAMMEAHDASHRAEILEWIRARGRA